MARKFRKVSEIVLVPLIKDSFERVGIEGVTHEKIALVFRLIAGGIASYFFQQPNDLIDVGFLRFKKNPDKNELFAVDIIKDEDAGVVNADTLYRYYTGDLNSERALQNTMNNFVNELLSYSQAQSESISSLTGKLKKRRKQNGLQKN